MNEPKREKIAEVTVGKYYAYKSNVTSLAEPMWYDENGIVVDGGMKSLLEELAKLSLAEWRRDSEALRALEGMNALVDTNDGHHEVEVFFDDDRPSIVYEGTTLREAIEKAQKV